MGLADDNPLGSNMRNLSVAVFVPALLAGLMLTNGASAGALYSNFGPGQSYNAFSGVFEGGINNPITHNQQSSLASFVATGSGLVDVIHAPMFHFTSPSTDVMVLYSDTLVGGVHKPNAHSDPLAPFNPATFAPLGMSSSFTALGPMETFKFTADVSLIAGQTYWIGLFTDTVSADNWYFNSTGQTTAFCATFGPVPIALTNFGCTQPGDHTTPAFDIIGRTAVPEPITMSLFGVGIAGMVTIRRRRKPSRSQG
jgi:hypothetical protein